MSQDTSHRSADVFGIGRDIPLNYVNRALVDDVFLDCLGRDKHIVVHGSSKQGKTSLRRRNLSITEETNDVFFSVSPH